MTLDNKPLLSRTKRCPHCGEFDISIIDHEVRTFGDKQALWMQFFCEWCGYGWVEIVPIHEVKDGQE